MKLIQTGKYSRVYFDEQAQTFIKEFSPKPFDRLRYLLRLRPYPGHNFALIAARLAELGVTTPEITLAEPYCLITRDVGADAPLSERIQDSPLLQQQYLELLALCWRNRLFCRGLHTRNFLVKGERLVVIDLDAYKDCRWLPFNRHEFLYCWESVLQPGEKALFPRLLSMLGLPADFMKGKLKADRRP
ncbi:hypothetical protein JGK42_000424 [Aeromonas veronii]|nr:hypothetical protein [Aeromonas veronii]